jgi:hypothetical protein
MTSGVDSPDLELDGGLGNSFCHPDSRELVDESVAGCDCQVDTDLSFDMTGL